MRCWVCLLIAVSTIGFIYAQDLLWNEDGVPVRKGFNLNWGGRTAVTSGGAVIQVWSDSHRNDQDIYARAFSIDGNPLWPEEAVAVSGTDAIECGPQVIASIDGGVFIAWREVDPATSLEHLLIQKLTATGSEVFPAGGVRLTATPVWLNRVSLLADNSGGVIATWSLSDNDQESLLAQHINANGAIMWGNGNPVILDTGPSYFFLSPTQSMIGMDDGGLILAYGCRFEVRGVRLDYSGQVLWSRALVVTMEQLREVALVLAEHPTCVWSDDMMNQYAVRFDFNGDPIDSQPLPTGQSYSLVGEGQVMAIGTHCYIGCYDLLTGAVILKRLDADGSLPWGASGRVIDTPPADGQLTGIRLTQDTYGGFYFGCLSPGNGGYSFIQRFDAGGEAVWDSGIRIPFRHFAYSTGLSLAATEAGVAVSFVDVRECRTVLVMNSLTPTGGFLGPEEGRPACGGTGGTLLDFASAYWRGEIHVVWLELAEAGGYSLFYQVVEEDGALRYPVEGLEITTNTLTALSKRGIAVDDRGVAGFAYFGVTETGFGVYFQRVSPTGTLMEPEGGRLVSNSEQCCMEPAITSSATGVFDLVWSQQATMGYTYSRGYVQRIADGVPQWGEYGREIVNRPGEGLHLVDVQDGWIVWEVSSGHLVVFCLNSDGDIESGWPQSGIELPGAQNCSITPDQDETLLVVVVEGSEYNPDSTRCMVHRLSRKGQALTPPGGVELTSGDGGIVQPAICCEDGLYLAYTSSTLYRNDYMVIHYDDDFRMLWEQTAINLPGPGMEPPAIAPFTFYEAAGVLVTGTRGDLGDSRPTELVMQSVSSAGELRWEPDGVPVGSGVFRQHRPQILKTGANTAAMIWMDSRGAMDGESRFDIYAQKVRIGNVSGGTDTNPPESIALENTPNPFNPSTCFRFTIAKEDRISLRIFNTRGQLVRTLLDERVGAGSHACTWNGADDQGQPASSGVYFCRLETRANGSATRKCVIMK